MSERRLKRLPPSAVKARAHRDARSRRTIRLAGPRVRGDNPAPMTHTPPRNEPVWREAASLVVPTFNGTLDADVLVIGGGITGLTLAWTLVESGAVVGLFEAEDLAGAASGRNAGFLRAAAAEPYEEQIAFWGRAGARAVTEIGRRTHRRVKQLVDQLGIECEYAPSGSLRLTRTEEESEEHRASIPLLKADGFTMREVPLADAVPPEVAGGFHAAFLSPEDGEIHPVRFLEGLARASLQRGAKLFSHSPVTTARWSGGLWELRIGSGVARARTLVLASNAWAPRLCPELEPIIVPRRGQMLSTAPIGRKVAIAPTYAHYGYQYWRQLPDGRLVIGGWRDLDPDGEVGYSVETNERIQGAIESGLRELVPEGVAVERRWAGTMAFARDGRPLVGWLDAAHHLAIVGGFTGHGMGMAASCTQDLALLLDWKPAPGIASFDPARFGDLRVTTTGLTTLGAR